MLLHSIVYNFLTYDEWLKNPNFEVGLSFEVFFLVYDHWHFNAMIVNWLLLTNLIVSRNHELKYLDQLWATPQINYIYSLNLTENNLQDSSVCPLAIHKNRFDCLNYQFWQSLFYVGIILAFHKSQRYSNSHELICLNLLQLLKQDNESNSIMSLL